MRPEFLTDLDDYFCKKYNNQTKLAAIPGFVQPIASQENDFAADPEQYKLCRQKNPLELLASFKEGLIDKDFSFSFTEVTLLQRFADIRRKDAFHKILPSAFQKYSLDIRLFYRDLSISEKIWKRILKGAYYPSKNTILAIALVGGMNFKDASILLASCEYEFDFESVRDTVVGYLLTYGIYNVGLVQSALKEYKITCLPLKQD